MINFHIPGLVPHFELNKKLINAIKEYPQYFYDGIKISGVYGIFNAHRYGGGRVTTGVMVDENLEKEIVNTYNSLNVSVIQVFSNSEIEPEMFGDYYCNIDLELCHNDMNKIIITSNELKQYIHSKFPKYKFMSSITNTESSNIEKIENNDLDIIVVNANLNNTNELFNISNKSKIELLVNSQCIKNCPFEKEHYKNISKMQLGEIIEPFVCPYKANVNHSLEYTKTLDSFISVEDLYNKYAPAGFNIFKINGRTVPSKDVMEYYLYYMVKSEYQNEVKELLS